MTDKRIETYLRKSTRGLWGKKRNEVREELSSHIEGRVNAHLIGGLSESDAVEKTLVELGHPTNVSAGMARVYTLPIVAGSGMMLAMWCALVVVVLLSGSTAQNLETINVIPADECLEAKGEIPNYCMTNENYTTLEVLQKTLEGQGVKIGSIGDMWALKFPGNHTVVLPYYSPQTFEMQDESGKNIILRTRPEYFSVAELIKAISRSSIELVKLEGWENPTLQVNQAAIQLSRGEQIIGKKDFYTPYFHNTLFQGMGFFGNVLGIDKSIVLFDKASDMNSITQTVRLRVGAKEGDVYGIALLENAKDVYVGNTDELVDLALFTDVIPATADGTVQFELPKQDFVFNSRVTDVGQAVLVRLSGDFPKGEAWEVVPPEQITLE